MDAIEQTPEMLQRIDSLMAKYRKKGIFLSAETSDFTGRQDETNN